MPPKKHIIIIGVLCVISLGLGYWVGLPKEEGSGGGGKEPAFLKKGLVAYYPFNGNAKDKSGNGNDGEVKGATLTLDRYGKERSAYLFDDKNDCIDVPNHPSLHLNEEVTISVWLKIDSIPANGTSNYILTKAWCGEVKAWYGEARHGLQMKISDYKNWDAIIADSYSLSDGVEHDRPGGSPVPFKHGIPFSKLPLKQFFQIICTYDGEYIRAYMSGALLRVSRKMQGTLDAINGNLQIGQPQGINVHVKLGRPSPSFIGVADDIRIYNRALSEAEVKALYEFEKPKTQQASTVKPPAVVAPTPVNPQPIPTPVKPKPTPTPIGAGVAVDDSKGPIGIVGKGEALVISPAGSGGTRYLLVEIYLTRANENDKDFKGAIDTNSKKLLSRTRDTLSERNIKELSNPQVKEQIKNDLKKQYQIILGSEHPIKELVVTKWIMQ